jgi:tetratricopeptide (TPR) repeat protein
MSSQKNHVTHRDRQPPRRRVAKGIVRMAVLFGSFAALIFFLIQVLSRKKDLPDEASLRSAPSTAADGTTTRTAPYAGSLVCRDCHREKYDSWSTSHHALAERPIRLDVDNAAFEPARSFEHGGESTRVALIGGKPEIQTLGFGGKLEGYAPTRVLGVFPLRQFIVMTRDGRDQALPAAFDPSQNDWFSVYGDEDRRPGEWGHWTGRGMNWNSMCAYCHNTFVQKNYNASTDSYRTTMVETGVGCESCHGPMKEHAAWRARKGAGQGTDPTLPVRTREQHLATCGSCHARRIELTGKFVPGESFFDHFGLAIPDQEDIFYADGQVREEDFELTSFLSSRMCRAGVTCQDCHDSHSGKTLREGNELCMRCHRSADAKIPQIEPIKHTFHKEQGAGNACVGCHMPPTTYMQRHARRDHGFTIPDPLLTLQHGIPNACGRCHSNKSPSWMLATVERWYGPKMNRHSRARAQWMARARADDSAVESGVREMLEGEDIALWRASAARVGEHFLDAPAFVQALVGRLDDRDPLVRASAAATLEHAVERSPAVVPALSKARRDPVRAVRVAAAWALRDRALENDEAAQDLEHYLAFAADQPGGQLQRGALELARHRPNAALEHFQKAAAWDPESAPVHHELAIAYSAVGRAKDAVTEVEVACRLAPKEAEYPFRLGLAWSEAGSLSRAIEAFEKAVQLNPRHARAWYNLGLAQDQAQDHGAALLSLAKAAQVEPRDASFPFARATVLLKLGRKADARRELDRALEIAPGYADAQRLMQTL